MNNVVQLRRNNFHPGDKVVIGDSDYEFEVANLGYCGPMKSELMEYQGRMVNSDEFVQIRVPGSESGVINIHSSFLTLINRKSQVL